MKLPLKSLKILGVLCAVLVSMVAAVEYHHVITRGSLGAAVFLLVLIVFILLYKRFNVWRRALYINRQIEKKGAQLEPGLNAFSLNGVVYMSIFGFFLCVLVTSNALTTALEPLFGFHPNHSVFIYGLFAALTMIFAYAPLRRLSLLFVLVITGERKINTFEREKVNRLLEKYINIDSLRILIYFTYAVFIVFFSFQHITPDKAGNTEGSDWEIIRYTFLTFLAFDQLIKYIQSVEEKLA